MRLAHVSLGLLAVGALIGCSAASTSTSGPATPVVSGAGPTTPAVTAAAPTTAAATVTAAAPTAADAVTTPTPTYPGQGNLGTATVKGTLALSGTYVTNGTPLIGSVDYTQSIQSDVQGDNACVDFATHGNFKGNGAGFEITPPSLTIAGQTIAFDGGATDAYHGPATYQQQAGGVVVNITIGDQASVFSDPGTAMLQLTVNADGSGTLTFSGLYDEMGSGYDLDGSVTWTCG